MKDRIYCTNRPCYNRAKYGITVNWQDSTPGGIIMDYHGGMRLCQEHTQELMEEVLNNGLTIESIDLIEPEPEPEPEPDRR